ncbi:hypothetical protein GGI21_000800 [Coemansia aciculifera]|nr:hypothetical protein GGI21_000800 [Coemansia aciculifera]
MRRGRTARRRRQRIDSSSSAGRPCTDEVWTNLRGWCKAQGMPKTKLTLAYFPDTFRGMMATSDIGLGEDVVRVPERLLVTASKVKRSTLARATSIDSSSRTDRWDLSEHQSLAYWVYVETELKDRSEWHNYICSLPHDFASIPLYVLSGNSPSAAVDTTSSSCAQWVSAHLPQSLRQRVTEQQSKLFGDWSHTLASSAVSRSRPLSNWRLYVWSWLVVSTRCIHLGRRHGSACSAPSLKSDRPRSSHSIGSQDSITLAPMLDLLNHSSQASISTLFDAERGEFLIKTKRAFRAGHEVFISYGPHDNLFLLAEYGFALERNPYQHLDLDHAAELWVASAKARMQAMKRVVAPASPADIDALVDVLKQHGLWGDFGVSLDDTEPPYRLQAALRLLLAVVQHGVPLKRAIAQWERWRRGEPDGGESSAMEDATASWISAACQGLLNASARMLRDADDAKHSAWHDGPSAFLVCCIHMVWLEINHIAARNCADSSVHVTTRNPTPE